MVAATVHQLHLTTVRSPTRGPDSPDIEVFAYLIRHPDGLFLVDTGIGSGNSLVDERFDPERYSLAERLRRLGVGTRDISAVINSHLHFDHCGNNRLFAGIPTYIQRREFEAASAPSYTVRDWFAFEGARLELLDGDRELAPGLTLIATPGHTPGHQSLAIEGAGTLRLIAAQAAYTAREFEAGGDIAAAQDGLAQTYLGTIAYLKSLGPAEVWFSHDRGAWRP